jgi:hypothetical protein
MMKPTDTNTDIVNNNSTCCEPQQYKCCQIDSDCCTNWGQLKCSVGVCVFPGKQSFSKPTMKKEEEVVPLSSATSSNGVPTLLLGLRHTKAGRKRLDDLFWSVADPKNKQAQQVNGPKDIASLLLSSPHDLTQAKKWLQKIHADMSTLRVLPTGDAIEVEWPMGKGRTKAPKVSDLSFADYIVLKGATDNHLTSKLFQSSRNGRKKKKKDSNKKNPFSVQTSTIKRRRMDDSFGPAAQKKAYNVPASLKGTNKENVQMVFGTGTFGYRKEDISMFFSTYATTSSINDVSFDVSNKWTGKTGKNFVEGELDVSYIAGMAPGVKTLVANSNISASTESGEGFGAALLAFLVELNSRDKVCV